MVFAPGSGAPANIIAPRRTHPNRPASRWPKFVATNPGCRQFAVTPVSATRRLRQGESLSSITADFCCRLGVGPRVLPATDDPVRTRLRTDEGWLDFQDYFVRLQ